MMRCKNVIMASLTEWGLHSQVINGILVKVGLIVHWVYEHTQGHFQILNM